jgi:hypothetical protein
MDRLVEEASDEVKQVVKRVSGTHLPPLSPSYPPTLSSICFQVAEEKEAVDQPDSIDKYERMAALNVLLQLLTLLLYNIPGHLVSVCVGITASYMKNEGMSGQGRNP